MERREREGKGRLRPMEEKDNQAMYEIIRGLLKSYGLDIPGTAYFDAQLQNLYEFYRQEERSEYWVIEEDGRVVGGVGVAPFAGDTTVGELQKLYILPAAQGRGYSHLLMRQAIAFAARYYPSLYLETTDVLERANALYVSYGFRLLKAPLVGSEHGAMNRWFLLPLGEHMIRKS